MEAGDHAAITEDDPRIGTWDSEPACGQRAHYPTRGLPHTAVRSARR
jgi:hypothetical protein